MRTLGVDLASQARTTAVCTIDWAVGTAVVTGLELGVTDQRIIALAADVDVIGIDAPFGWPLRFVDLVLSHQEGRADQPDWTNERRDQLRFRRTDVYVRDHLRRWPLSVSSDLIAIVAMRCAGLLDRLGVEDRSGDGRVFETYPALALACWGLPSFGIKSARSTQLLPGLLRELRNRCPWLAIPSGAEARCRRSDHAFDAMLASLVARAGAIGLIEPVPAADAERAKVEGWIAVPQQDSLGRLADPVAATPVPDRASIQPSKSEDGL